VKRFGFDVVKRPTGGRAILHDQELTYAVVAATDDASVGGTLQQSHARISEIFRRALARLGVAASLAGPAATVTPEPLDRSRVSAPCFASATRTELLVDGRKILGSAQRRGARAFLQHGSLLLGDGHLRLAECLRLTPPQRDRWRERLGASTTTVPGGLMLDALIGAVRGSLSED
jgi:lipoate-protein ligase A